MTAIAAVPMTTPMTLPVPPKIETPPITAAGDRIHLVADADALLGDTEPAHQEKSGKPGHAAAEDESEDSGPVDRHAREACGRGVSADRKELPAEDCLGDDPVPGERDDGEDQNEDRNSEDLSLAQRDEVGRRSR